jgi:hypothetical protein
MKVSGQLHVPAALLPGKELPVPIGYEVGWTPDPAWTTWREFLTLPGLELLPLRRPVRREILRTVSIVRVTDLVRFT